MGHLGRLYNCFQTNKIAITHITLEYFLNIKMFVSLPIITTALVTLSTLASTVSASCCAKPTYKHQKKILDNYIASWNGDTSRGNATFDSDAKLFADRILNGTGSIDIYPIQTSVGIMDFIQKGRFGWEKYQFELVNWAGGEGYNIALRWTLHGVVGADFPKRANM